MVEERKATRALVELGLEMVEAGALTIAPEDIHAWLLAEGELCQRCFFSVAHIWRKE